MRRRKTSTVMHKYHPTKGFTLLEVMVALAVIGLVLPSVLINEAERIHSVRVMEERMIANMVAHNQLARLRLGNRWSGTRPARVEEGSEPMAGREWFWRAESKPTEVEDYYRIAIEVGATKGAEPPLVRVQAYFGVN